jgi:hypothetical protein
MAGFPTPAFNPSDSQIEAAAVTIACSLGHPDPYDFATGAIEAPIRIWEHFSEMAKQALVAASKA